KAAAALGISTTTPVAADAEARVRRRVSPGTTPSGLGSCGPPAASHRRSGSHAAARDDRSRSSRGVSDSRGRGGVTGGFPRNGDRGHRGSGVTVGACRRNLPAQIREAMNDLARRIAKLEQAASVRRDNRLVLRFEGPGSEKFRQPTKEEIEAASDVLVLQFVAAKDGRPA